MCTLGVFIALHIICIFSQVVVPIVSRLADQVENGVVYQGLLFLPGLHPILSDLYMGQVIRIGVVLRPLGQLLGEEEILKRVFGLVWHFRVQFGEQVDDLLVARIKLRVVWFDHNINNLLLNVSGQFAAIPSHKLYAFIFQWELGLVWSAHQDFFEVSELVGHVLFLHQQN